MIPIGNARGVTQEDLNSETVWFCLPGASDYGRLKVNVSSGDSPRAFIHMYIYLYNVYVRCLGSLGGAFGVLGSGT